MAQKSVASLPMLHIRCAQSIPISICTPLLYKKRNVRAHIELTAISSITTCSASPCWIGWLSTRSVTMIPDPRSIKVKSGNSLHDYLLTELWFTKQATTDLNTCQVDSAKCAGIQFADMLAGVVQGRFEAGRFECFVTLQSKLNLKRLFFTR